METFRSVCPYDCPDMCGLIVHVEGLKAVKVQGDPDHPFTRGTLCQKMAHYEKTVHSQRRLTTPLRRKGPKGKASFESITWEEAISTITGRWHEIIERYGAEAILPYSYAGTMGLVQRNAGHPFFHSLGASRLERTICSPAKAYGWSAVMGQTMGPDPHEIQHSDLIILWGLHGLATNLHIMHDIKIAKQRGAKVWLIDTYETSTAAIADKVILPRPGTDGALALAMMHIIDRDGLADGKFISSSVQGYDGLKQAVLPTYDPKYVSEITGIASAVIEEVAKAYGSARAPFIRLGSGLSRYSNGAMTVRAITCLAAVVGAWGKCGGGLLSSIAADKGLDTSLVTREDFLKEPSRIVNMNQLGDALCELSDPPIMSLYVYHSNPAIIAPDQSRVLQGLDRDDLFTVVHERFLTDTAQYADIVLPATTSLEHSDIYRSYGHYGIQSGRRVIDPVGEAKSNWDVFCLLAAGMGIDEPFFRQSADDLIDQIVEKAGSLLEGDSLAALQAGLPVKLPLPDGYKLRFATPSGKIEIFNPREDDSLPTYNKPHGDHEPLWLVNSPDGRLLNSSFNERDDLTASNKKLLLMNEADGADRALKEGQKVVVSNERGEVTFFLHLTSRVPSGVVVAEGVWSIENSLGSRSVNALTSQRLTDKGKGSTFYDVKVNVRAAN